MVVGIKVIYSIKNIFPEKTRSALLNALVLSHLHYPIVLFSGPKKSLRVTLNKQLNWGIKSCFNRTKFDRITDLKIKHKILSVEYLIKYRVFIYFIKLLKGDLPTFDELMLIWMTEQTSCHLEQTKKQMQCKTIFQKKQLTGITIYLSPWGGISLKSGLSKLQWNIISGMSF